MPAPEAPPRALPEPPLPRTLPGLLAALAALNADAGWSQEAIIGFVDRTAAACGIRVRHDALEYHEVEVAAAEALSPEPAPESTPEPAAPPSAGAGAGAGASKRPAARGGVRLVRAPQEGGAARRRLALEAAFDPELADEGGPPPPLFRGASVARLVLSGLRAQQEGGAGGPRPPLHADCNGLVLDARSWRALAVPPPALALRPAARPVDEALAAGWYDVYPVDDGTVLTLYAWEHPVQGGVWGLASANGYDVSGYRWSGAKTFAEVVADLAARLYPGFVEDAGLSLVEGGGRLAFSRLDPRRCYTFGFRHHDFHPLAADPERIWQIQQVDLSGPAPVVVPGPGLPGLPAQRPLSGEELLALAGGPPSLAALEAAGGRALHQAADFVARRGPGAPPASRGRPPELNYGLILRWGAAAGPAPAGVPACVLVDSPLLQRVRKLAYERPPAAVRPHVTFANRLEYNALRAFLGPARDDFLALFPAWGGRFARYSAFLEEVAGFVHHSLRQAALGDAAAPPPRDTPLALAAGAVLDDLRGRHREALSGYGPDARGILADLVRSPFYALLYLRSFRPAAAHAERARAAALAAERARARP